MRVLLVQAYLGRVERYGCVFPLGLCYIATALAARGHQVRLLDMNLYDTPYAKLETVVRECTPNVVGISLRNIDTTDRLDPFYYYSTLRSIIASVKATDPHVRLMIGGAGFSMFARVIMQRHPELDYGVFLEGEETTPDLLEHLDSPEMVKGIYFRRDGAVHFTGHRPFPDVHALPAPRRNFAEVAKYREPRSMGVQAKRGCSLRCAYCSYPFLNGTTIRIRSPKAVVDEIEHLHTVFNLDEVIFVDNIFNIPEAHAKAICREIIARDLKVRWSAWFDVGTLSEDLVRLASQSGCYRICVSPDGASDASLRALGKDFNETAIQRVIGIARMFPEIEFRFSLFCSPPGQNLSGVIKTVKLFVKTHILLRNGRCLVSWVRLLPNTVMYDTAIAEGVIRDTIDLLPPEEHGIGNLFYSCSRTGFYATPLFIGIAMVCSVGKRLMTLVRALRTCSNCVRRRTP